MLVKGLKEMEELADIEEEIELLLGLFNFSAPVDIDIRFNGEENRKLVEVKVDKDRREKFPLYFDGETVAGK
ncbi:5539_t:CDS:2, partial [Entrophospora sp. SA101]